MGYLEFSPDGIGSVIINFACDKCGNEVTSEEMRLPSPNYWADKASDSHGENYSEVECEKCGKEFTISINVGWSDSYIDIDDVDDESMSFDIIDSYNYLDDYALEQIDAIVQSGNYIIQFGNEINNLKKLNELSIVDENIQETLRRQVYSGAITCLEDYLSTRLIQLVLNDENHFKRFVMTFDPIKKRSFELSTIYEQFDKLRDIVKHELTNVIYHKLYNVRSMYVDTLQIKFPEISDLMQIIMIRHDMVHRNGRNKNGEKIEVSIEAVAKVIDKVEVFVNQIETEIL